MASRSAAQRRRAAAPMRRVARTTLAAAAGLLTALACGQAVAAPDDPDSLFSRPVALIVAIALVSLAPFAFMTLTAFLKISTVLQIVRGAIGAQNVPSSTVIMALAAALTLVAMAPVGARIMDRAAP
ncbi:MAG: hypothetical protein MUF54_10205, partial [Polyangiaceae bacterium]|nr:hypothetical protein [Polyangiaceae bacterium]